MFHGAFDEQKVLTLLFLANEDARYLAATWSISSWQKLTDSSLALMAAVRSNEFDINEHCPITKPAEGPSAASHITAQPR